MADKPLEGGQVVEHGPPSKMSENWNTAGQNPGQVAYDPEAGPDSVSGGVVGDAAAMYGKGTVTPVTPQPGQPEAVRDYSKDAVQNAARVGAGYQDDVLGTTEIGIGGNNVYSNVESEVAAPDVGSAPQ
eukprot:jgi/Chlat1/2792/Chrsp187S02958